jgi:hypothetical protein
MHEYTIDSNTPIIVIKAGASWGEMSNFKPTRSRFANTFSEEEMIIHPNEFSCSYEGAENAPIVGAAYSAMGYFGFLRDGYVVLTPAENVIVHGSNGVKSEILTDPLAV